MRNLYAVGDIHGNFTNFEKLMGNAKNSDYILVGDVGLGFHSKEYYTKWFSEWNDRLKKDGNIVYLMRGNHDDPSFWKEKKIDFSNIRLVQDYEVLRLKNKNILCVGGALSVDRKHRVEGLTYWKDEEFVYDEDLTSTFTNIDIVMTHSAPEFCYPRGYDTKFLQGFYYYDTNLRTDLVVERIAMARMYQVLTRGGLFGKPNEIFAWYYGHFHQSKTEYHNDIMFRLCNINEIVEIK
jgi:UDP-2,3-diacylglucosamine pyrophosphatase LpxH